MVRYNKFWVEDLCSINCTNNLKTNISKGFFGFNSCPESSEISDCFCSYPEKVKQAIESGNLNRAFEYVNEYIKNHQNVFFVFENIETKKHILLPSKIRFDKEYIARAKKKLKKLLKLDFDRILHWVLTIPNTELKDFSKDYANLKRALVFFIMKLKKYFSNVKYLVTYETTLSGVQLHQHIHLLLFEVGRIPYKIFKELKGYWQRLTGSGYDFLKIVPSHRVNVFYYVLKYVLKEVSIVNITSVCLFSVKGKSYSMSQELSAFLKTDVVKKSKYIFLHRLYYDVGYWNIFLQDYDWEPGTLEFFLSKQPPDDVKRWKEDALKMQKR